MKGRNGSREDCVDRAHGKRCGPCSGITLLLTPVLGITWLLIMWLLFRWQDRMGNAVSSKKKGRLANEGDCNGVSEGCREPGREWGTRDVKKDAKTRVWSRRQFYFSQGWIYTITWVTEGGGKYETFMQAKDTVFVWSGNWLMLTGCQKDHRFVNLLVSRMLVFQKCYRSSHWVPWHQMYLSARSELYHIIIHLDHQICISLLQLTGDFPWT